MVGGDLQVVLEHFGAELCLLRRLLFITAVLHNLLVTWRIDGEIDSVSPASDLLALCGDLGPELGLIP